MRGRILPLLAAERSQMRRMHAPSGERFVSSIKTHIGLVGCHSFVAVQRVMEPHWQLLVDFKLPVAHEPFPRWPTISRSALSTDYLLNTSTGDGGWALLVLDAAGIGAASLD